MAEYPGPSGLKVDPSFSSRLDISGFDQMMKDPTQCYKFYWLESVVERIGEGVSETDLERIVDGMICNAWYSVKEFHIHLSGVTGDGKVTDSLEKAVLRLGEISSLPPDASKAEILYGLKRFSSDRELKKDKEQLILNVPYRALAGFFKNAGARVNWSSGGLVSFVRDFNKDHPLSYTFGEYHKLSTKIFFHPDWVRLIRENTVPINGWIQYEKVKWLQNRNPEVPGMVYKLTPLNQKMRKLDKVRELWEKALECEDFPDIFNGESLRSKPFDIDHFVPWSFLMNDELWDLMPIDSSLNSSKSDSLPPWDPFFAAFSENQYRLYCLIQERSGIRASYRKCWRDNLHSIWAGQELFRPGNDRQTFNEILLKHMRPVYDSARLQGYGIWNGILLRKF